MAGHSAVRVSAVGTLKELHVSVLWAPPGRRHGRNNLKTDRRPARKIAARAPRAEKSGFRRDTHSTTVHTAVDLEGWAFFVEVLVSLGVLYFVLSQGEFL